MDKEFWKKRYQDKWGDGNLRETMFMELMASLGFEVKKFGFETLSEKYNPKSPDERGKPDFYIEKNGEKIFFEVTGTNVASVTPEKKIWIRPDKIAYIKKYRLRTYCVHILDRLKLIRFVDMTKVSDKNIVHPVIRGTEETYYEVDPMLCLSLEQFKTELERHDI
jgi:hypothetical protein